ncbi:MAG: PAS domain S-box protein, partial [Pseudomonadota bacterium]
LERKVAERTAELEENIRTLAEAQKALKENEKKFRVVVENSNDGISIIREDKLVYVNPRYLEIFGYSRPEDLIGKRGDVHVHPEDREEVMERVLRRQRGEKVADRYRWRGIRTDGEVRHIEVSARKTLYEGKSANLAFLRDVTDSVKSEEAIRESEEKFRAISESAHEAIIMLDDYGLITYWNQAAETIFGYAANEALGKYIPEILIPERFHDYYTKIFKKRRETSQIAVAEKSVERVALRKNGEEFPVEVSLSSALIQGETQVIWIVRDQTERKKAEEALLKKTDELDQNKNQLQSALDELSSLIQQVAIKKDFDVRFKNPNLVKCYETMECQKTDCPCFGQEPMRCWQVSGTFSQGKIQGSFAKKINNCNKCRVFQESSPDHFCQIGEHFNNMMHILEYNKLKLVEANKALKMTQAQIIQQEKMASIGQLAAGVAHEINNPTGFIGSNLGTFSDYQESIGKVIGGYRGLFSQLEEKGQFHEPMMKEADRIKALESELDIDFILQDIPGLILESQDGVERIKNIVTNLKDFAHPGKKERVYADINRNLDSTLNIVWNELKYKVTVTKEYGDIPEVQCHPQQLNQVFMNLLVNAAQAIEEKGKIGIKTGRHNGGVRIQISDTGRGIPEENLSRIFDPFFTTKDIGKGTGLGLNLAYNIIKEHWGSIEVESEVGRGTTFSIMIPLDGDKG